MFKLKSNPVRTETDVRRSFETDETSFLGGGHGSHGGHGSRSGHDSRHRCRHRRRKVVVATAVVTAAVVTFRMAKKPRTIAGTLSEGQSRQRLHHAKSWQVRRALVL